MADDNQNSPSSKPSTSAPVPTNSQIQPVIQPPAKKAKVETPFNPLRVPLVAHNDMLMTEFQNIDEIHQYIDKVRFAHRAMQEVEANEIVDTMLSATVLRHGRSLHILNAFDLPGFEFSLPPNALNCDGSTAIQTILEPEFDSYSTDVAVPRKLTVRSYKFVSSVALIVLHPQSII